MKMNRYRFSQNCLLVCLLLIVGMNAKDMIAAMSDWEKGLYAIVIIITFGVGAVLSVLSMVPTPRKKSLRRR